MPLPGIAVLNPIFNPSLSAITAITSVFRSLSGSWVAFITTQSPHTFVTGQIIKMLVPLDYGMQEINGAVVNVLGINASFPNMFLIDLDIRSYQPFVVPAAPKQFAQAIPIGEQNLQLNGAERNILGPPFPLAGSNVPNNFD